MLQHNSVGIFESLWSQVGSKKSLQSSMGNFHVQQ